MLALRAESKAMLARREPRPSGPPASEGRRLEGPCAAGSASGPKPWAEVIELRRFELESS